MICIGLTGGIGVGKTTVAGFFSERDVIVLEADKIVHQFLTSDHWVYQEIVSHWGHHCLIPGEKAVDRKKLAEFVFQEKGALKQLLDILYPPLKQVVEEEMKKASNLGIPFFLFDASQILEAGWEKMFDILILVRAEFEKRRDRLLKEGRLNLDQILLRMGFQWPDWIKMRYVDFVVDNSGSLQNTRDAVDRIYDELLRYPHG